MMTEQEVEFLRQTNEVCNEQQNYKDAECCVYQQE
jgi:hypothetical protein